MKTTYLNEIIAAPNVDIGVKLLEYLMNIRESANLMIMATSVNEMDWKKSHRLLADSFKAKIDQLSYSDQSKLSNFTSIIRYRDYSTQCMRGLSITFGRMPESSTYDSSFKNEVDSFIRNLPKTKQGLGMYITLPIIRIALMVHGMRTSLDGSEQLNPLVLDDFALLDFNSYEWRYTVDQRSEQYEVKIDSNDPERNSFYLRVSKPSKQASKKLIEPCWVFNNKATGLSLYNIAELKNLKPIFNEKPVYISVQKLVNEGDDIEKVNEKNIERLSHAISNHEAYWSGILYDLLNKAGIEFKRRVFNSESNIFVHDDFKGRGIELTKDFLGVHSDQVITNNTFSLRYFIDPEVYSSDNDDAAELLSERFEQSLHELCDIQKQSSDLVSLEFELVSSLQEADLVVGRYDKDSSWVSSIDIASMDHYGRKKMTDLMNGIINTQQFIHLDQSFSIKMLERAVSECFLKKWLFQQQPIKDITLNEPPKSTGNKYLVLSTVRKRQLKTKPKKDNIFYCCYQVETRNDQLNFSKPSLFAEMGVIPKSKESDRLDFVDFYYPYIDEKLPQLDCILELIDDADEKDAIINAIGTRYLNNDVTLIFEYNDESLISVWESQKNDLWFPPDLDEFSSSQGDFFDFIQRGIDAKAYTKSQSDGKITQDKRLSSDPHYEVMVDGNKLLVHRKRYNQNKTIGRHILRQFAQVYPTNTSLTINECGIWISGLLSPEAGAYKDSGVAQTIYDKIPNLLI